MKNFFYCLLGGLVPALIVFVTHGLFRAPSAQAAALIVADGSFLSAVLMIGVALLSWMANMGQFTALKYIGHLVKSTFAWGYPRRRAMAYGDFKEEIEAQEEKREFKPLLYAGLVYLFIAIISTILFNH